MRLDVLVVDDDEDIAVVTCRVLGRVHATRFALSVDDALAAVAARVPDVVVSDFYMPSRNGDELLAILAERHPSVRRVLHSSQRAEDQQRLVDSGLAHAFVCKVEMDALLVTVEGGNEPHSGADSGAPFTVVSGGRGREPGEGGGAQS